MICLISDTHFGVKSFSKTVFNRQMEYFEMKFFPYLLKNKVKYVLHLGDLVDNRVYTDNWVDGQLKKRFFKWFDKHKINLICLVGNHDSYYKNTIVHNYQRANLKEFEYTKVIDTIETHTIEGIKIGFVPWLTQYSQIKDIPQPKDVDILCGHFEIAGSLMQGKQYSLGGIDHRIFDKYKLVLSGHFHATSQRKNVRYLGSQYQMKWSDYNNPKGFWTLNDKLNMKFVQNELTARFLKLFYMETDEGDIVLKLGGLGELKDITLQEAFNYTKKNHLKMIVKRYNNQELLEKYFEKISKKSLDKVEIINESSIIEDFDIFSFQEEIADEETTDFLSVSKSFIMNSQFSFDVDKDRLFNIFSTLMQETYDT